MVWFQITYIDGDNHINNGDADLSKNKWRFFQLNILYLNLHKCFKFNAEYKGWNIKL